MTKDNSTPRPWSQGVTLNTQQTRRWSKQQIEVNDYEEKRRIFSNFSSHDDGKSRKFICVCEKEEDARLITLAVNRDHVFEELVEALRLILPLAKGYAGTHLVASSDRYIDIAEQALSKASKLTEEKSYG